MSILAISVPHCTARILHEIEVPGEKTDSAQFHITLFDLGENVPIEKIAKAMVTTFKAIQGISPFLVKITNLGSFPSNGEGNQCPIIANVISKKLLDIRKNLKKYLDKEKIEYNKKFPSYKPHITLSYNDFEIKKTKIKPIEWSVQEFVLYGGEDGEDRIFITFPLSVVGSG